MIDHLFRFVQEDLASFGDLDAGEELLDVQTITDAMMTTAQKVAELGIRFALNLLVCWILVLYIMGNVEVGVGLTLGLFAIFGVIRYRTETVPIREMTYLFVIIALAAANGLAPVYQMVDVSTAPHYALSWGSVGVMALVNLLVVALVAVLESEKLVAHTATKLVLYDNIALIVPEKREELKADLEKRLGFPIENLEIGHVDFLKDSAFIKVYYHLPKGESNSVNMITRAKDYVE